MPPANARPDAAAAARAAASTVRTGTPLPAPAPSELNELTLTRVFDAPRALVWKAFTDAKHLARWWGPHGFTNPQARVDARAGGEIFVMMHGPAGTPFDMDMPMGGEVVEMREPERLVFDTRALAPDGSAMLQNRCVLTLAERGGKTTLTLHVTLTGMRPGTEPMRAGMKAGWTQSIEKLGAILGVHANEIVTTRTIAAPRAKVFAAFGDPAGISAWWGPEGFRTTTKKMEFKPFGEWRFVMHGPDGRDYENHIRYFDVAPPERIVYAHQGEGEHAGVHFTNIITLTELAPNRTAIELRAVFESATERDRAAEEYRAVEGGTQTLARLAAFVEE